ncbi:unnamed protein product [Caenorhabditis nigoni]
MALTAEEIANQKRILKNQREKQNYQDINKKLEKLGKQLPNPAEAKEDTIVQPMITEAKKITSSELTMTLTAEEIANQKRILKNQREKQNYQDINKKLEKLSKQLPNPTGAKLSQLETLKFANAYLESLKTMLNEKGDIKIEPEWIAQPVVVKQENVKSIKMEILDYQEQAEYGHMELHGEKKRFFKDLSRGAGET